MPNTYIPGQIVQLKDVITDPATGALVDDPSEAVTVYRPDGSTVSPAPSVTRASLGTYTAQVTLESGLGWWEYVWKATGPGAGASRGRFYVSPVP